MTVAEGFVNVFDEKGTVLGYKKRADIDRARDTLAAVFVFIRNQEGELLVAVIPDDQYKSRGTYVGKLGFPVASFLRRGESPEQAAQRALAKDLSVSDTGLRLLGTKYYVFDDGFKRHASVFLVEHDGPFKPDRYAASLLTWHTKQDLDDQLLLRQYQFAPSFIRLYAEYKNQL